MNRALRKGSLIVFGVTDPCVESANGIYEPSGETSNDHPVYVKKGQNYLSLCVKYYHPGKYCWGFSSSEFEIFESQDEHLHCANREGVVADQPYHCAQESWLVHSRIVRGDKASTVVVLALNFPEYFVPLIILARRGTINAVIARNILLSIFGKHFQIVQLFDYYLYL